jgi:hypothetical protein
VLARTLDEALNPEQYVARVVEEYGINLRGSGHDITVRFLDDLHAGNPGRVGFLEPDVINIAQLHHFASSHDVALTIAHELNHARIWLKGCPVESATEELAQAAENALESWIKGLR